MIEIEKRILEDEERCTDNQIYRIVKLPSELPLFRNDILEFWCPLVHFPGYSEGYDIGLCRIKKSFKYVDRMERHLNSCEILIPINSGMFVPLAPPDAEPVADNVQIVPVKRGELIYMAEGVWHFAAGPVSKSVLEYWVILKRATPEEDIHMHDLRERIIIKA